MKKILILMMSLALLMPLVGIGASDIQNMTDEELVALSREIVTELLNRKQKAHLSVGWYTVGKDIPAGVYLFEADKSVIEKEGKNYYRPMVQVFENWDARKNDPINGDIYFEIISPDLESYHYQVSLEEGNILEIKNSAVFITTHQVLVEFR